MDATVLNGGSRDDSFLGVLATALMSTNEELEMTQQQTLAVIATGIAGDAAKVGSVSVDTAQTLASALIATTDELGKVKRQLAEREMDLADVKGSLLMLLGDDGLVSSSVPGCIVHAFERESLRQRLSASESRMQLARIGLPISQLVAGDEVLPCFDGRRHDQQHHNKPMASGGPTAPCHCSSKPFGVDGPGYDHPVVSIMRENGNHWEEGAYCGAARKEGHQGGSSMSGMMRTVKKKKKHIFRIFIISYQWGHHWTS